MKAVAETMVFANGVSKTLIAARSGQVACTFSTCTPEGAKRCILQVINYMYTRFGVSPKDVSTHFFAHGDKPLIMVSFQQSMKARL